MPVQVLSQFKFADLRAVYLIDRAVGRVGLWVLPDAMADQCVRLPLGTSRPTNIPVEHGMPHWAIDPLVHVHRTGVALPGAFSQGRSLRNGPATAALKFVDQLQTQDGPTTWVTTTLADLDGLVATHRLAWREGDPAVTVTTSIANASAGPMTIELLTSFSLGGITPFATDTAAGRLVVHRVRSSWASEGRLDSQAAEQLQLEPSFSRFSVACERFGQVGTMPTRGFFPFAAIEDTAAGVTWGANLAWPGSWQMELYRRDDTFSLSGGLADYEFGHWRKTLGPGDTLTGPPATLSCVIGDIDDLCDRLTAQQQAAADRHPTIEQDLPIVYNEWCTTWGKPTHENVLAAADRLAGSDVKYFVIDAGWYDAHGDWRPRTERFPDLKATAAELRRRGFVPGLWFEYENCAPSSEAWHRTDLHLYRDGVPIVVNDRRFFDLTKPAARDYLAARLIDRLREDDIGYLKIDYNETIGLGADGCESSGEKLRQHVEAVLAFIGQIRDALPGLVIENCASGGHRLEPAMLGVTAMSSFSDAHESKDIPIIAANLHRMILPRQSQIWVVLRKADDEHRLAYSLAATFLGRMCLSGDIAELSPQQWAQCTAAQALYRQAWPAIKNGASRRHGPTQLSWRKPVGYQGMVRVSEDGEAALVVVHTFDEAPEWVDIELPPGRWEIVGQLGAQCAMVQSSASSNTLARIYTSHLSFTAGAALLKRNP